MDLEDPKITKTRLVGYPYNEKKPKAMGNLQNTQQEYNTDRFIRIYDKKRKEGRNPIESYVYASGKLAFETNSDFEMLQDLYFHFVKDDSAEYLNELEEFKNEFT